MYFVTAFIFLGHKYKGDDILRAGAFAPVASPSATRLKSIDQ